MKRQTMTIVVLALMAMGTSRAANVASDLAAGYTAWTNDSSGPSSVGFDPWILQVTSNDVAPNGMFIGDSTLNAGGTNDLVGTDINTAGQAWGMYANSGQTATGIRQLQGGPLLVGQNVTVFMDNGYLDGGSAVGIGLQNALGQSVVEVMFRGGQLTYEYNAATGLVATAFPYNSHGVRVGITLTSFTTFTGSIANGSTNVVFSDTLMNPSGGPLITQVRLFNFNAGGGSDHDQYFNLMGVSPPPASVPLPPPAFTAVSVTNGQYVSTWSTTNVAMYDLLSSTDLVAAVWSDVPGASNMVGFSGSMSLTNAGPAVMFYRVRQRDS